MSFNLLKDQYGHPTRVGVREPPLIAKHHACRRKQVVSFQCNLIHVVYVSAPTVSMCALDVIFFSVCTTRATCETCTLQKSFFPHPPCVWFNRLLDFVLSRSLLLLLLRVALILASFACALRVLPTPPQQEILIVRPAHLYAPAWPVLSVCCPSPLCNK